jgi:uncharacterized protein YbjT (DUF2867 family)
MPRILVTGGSGDLGSHVVSRLLARGDTVRVSSRRDKRDGDPEGVEWARCSLETGERLAEAVAGVDTVVHCASSPFRRTQQADVEGTGLLLDAARQAGVSHFLYISIVGIDRIPLPYYKAKLAAEQRIEQSGVPYSILRAPQFHTLIDRILAGFLRFPVGLLPSGFRFQPIETGEVAGRLVEIASGQPAGHAPDIAGPEVRSVTDLARAWLKARGRRCLLIPLPLFGKVASGFRAGHNTAPDSKYGKTTWEQWLSRKYGKETS